MFSAFPRNNPSRQKNQRGAALILALVVFSVVALLATSVGFDLLVSVRRVENQLHGQQAEAFLRGAEGIARSALQADFKSGNNIDHISEEWLDNPQEFPMENGVIRGVICDLQGRFNLNNLDGTATGGTGFTPSQEMFIRLLQALPLETPLDPTQAQEIASAVIDWIDADSDIKGMGGAEDGYYSDLEPPYHAGNQPFNSVSELRWIKGVTEEIYQALEPHVTALKETTLINVNTADVVVLRSINQAGTLLPIAEGEAQSIIVARDGDNDNPGGGFTTPAEFVQAHPLTTTLGNVNLAVRSDYFLLDADLLFLDRLYQQTAVLHRDSGGKIKTLARAQSGLGSCENETEL